MSAIEDLKVKVKSLTDQLEAATKSLHAAMIEAEPLKVGDLVRTLPDGYGRTHYGRVSKVFVKYGEVRVEASKYLPSGKFHSTQTFACGLGYWSHKPTADKITEADLPKPQSKPGRER